jgi:hypothetical protein
MTPSIAVTESAPPDLAGGLPPLVDRGASILVLSGLEPDRAEALAGAGALAFAHPLGSELRATRAGVPVIRDGLVVVGPHRITGDVEGSVSLLGGAVVTGRLRPGAVLKATGSVAVEGAVERATLAAGRSLRLVERAVRADIRCGVAEGIDGALCEAIAGTGAALREVAAAAYAAGRDDRARRDAIDEMVRGTHTGLVERIMAAEAVLGPAREGWPELLGEVATSLEAARRSLRGAALVDDPAAEIAHAADVLRTACVGSGGGGSVMSAPALHECGVEVDGTLRIGEAGIAHCDLRVSGDVLATGPRSAITGGEVVLGGRLRARRLSGDSARPLSIALLGAADVSEPLRVDEMDKGVEIRALGRTLRAPKRLKDVAVVVGTEGPQLLAGGKPVKT